MVRAASWRLSARRGGCMEMKIVLDWSVTSCPRYVMVYSILNSPSAFSRTNFRQVSPSKVMCSGSRTIRSNDKPILISATAMPLENGMDESLAGARGALVCGASLPCGLRHPASRECLPHINKDCFDANDVRQQ